MTRVAAVLLLCSIAAPAALAQNTDPHLLPDKERLGWRLYEQSCSICHTNPFPAGRKMGGGFRISI